MNKTVLRKYEEYVGKKFINNQGFEYIVIDYLGSKNVTVKFTIDDEVKITTLDLVIKCSCPHPTLYKSQNLDRFKKTVHNVGYLGEGKYLSINDDYKVWNHMIRRCYSTKQQDKSPTYIDCSVDERWPKYSGSLRVCSGCLKGSLKNINPSQAA